MYIYLQPYMCNTHVNMLYTYKALHRYYICYTTGRAGIIYTFLISTLALKILLYIDIVTSLDSSFFLLAVRRTLNFENEPIFFINKDLTRTFVNNHKMNIKPSSWPIHPACSLVQAQLSAHSYRLKPCLGLAISPLMQAVALFHN